MQTAIDYLSKYLEERKDKFTMDDRTITIYPDDRRLTHLESAKILLRIIFAREYYNHIDINFVETQEFPEEKKLVSSYSLGTGNDIKVDFVYTVGKADHFIIRHRYGKLPIWLPAILERFTKLI
jgi:hypothetical protein